MWARIAATALAALDKGTDEASFYQAKLKTGTFYMSYWVSQTRSLRKQIETSSEHIVAFEDADF